MNEITIRPATEDDAEIIARAFLVAMWTPEQRMQQMLPFCSTLAHRTDTLYSWRNAVVAQVNGEDAGVLIGYDGAHYDDMMAVTFTAVRDNMGIDHTAMNHEATTGEWYLDTLCVFPTFRRRGVATALLNHGIAKGLSTPGIDAVTLYVDGNHPWVVNLYASVGFKHAGRGFIFEQWYEKMEIRKDGRAEGGSSDCPNRVIRLSK